ncbi:MAG: hypothetical protein HRT38_17915 [Alteromonadaceae bacterium]|nr:hypothetical protein [Alteromonadaceae bacterium]
MAMLKLKKWYVIGKKEFPTPSFYGNDLKLHDVSTVDWKESEQSFTQYKGMVQGLPEITDEIQAIEALAAYGITGFDTRDSAKVWAKQLPVGTWKYLKVVS